MIVDGTTLALLGLIAITPLLEYVRKIKLGDFEAEIEPREVATVRQKAADALPPQEAPTPKTKSFEEEVIIQIKSDPRLGLAKIRIELEQVLRAIHAKISPNDQHERRIRVRQILERIQKTELLSAEIANAVIEVSNLANRAVHGETIRQKDAEEVARLGIRLIEMLRQKYLMQSLEPASINLITAKDMEVWTTKKYRVTSIIPRSSDKSEMNVRFLDQNGLDDLLDGYSEYTEFLVGVEPID